MPAKPTRKSAKTVYSPFDFRSLCLLPNGSDLLKKTKFFDVIPNIIYGRYNSSEQYLDIQFRLLFEDYYRPTQDKIHSYRDGKRSNLRFFTNVRLKKGQKLGYDGVLRQVFFRAKNHDEIDWEESKQLKGGSIVCLSNDDFRKTLFVGVIAIRSGPKNLSQGRLPVEFINTQMDDGSDLDDCEKYVMLESDAYFESYRHSLQVIQERTVKNFPMIDYIINLRSDIKMPSYMLKNQYFNFNPLMKDQDGVSNQRFQSVPIFQPSLWPSAESMEMDESQLEALKTALTKELAIIQGPPGTGKTFVGLKIINFLLHNNAPLPILIVCYTNHALDQFLEGVLRLTSNVIRLGSRSSNPVIKEHISSQSKIFSEADVIGMTTTGATKRRKRFDLLKPSIVVMEEAAEVLEGHAFTAISEHTKHLIMIGDHHQLQPHCSVYELECNYGLGVSLFERLVQNGLPYSTLRTQRRMRPCMSGLLVPHIYKILNNHQSVYDFEDVEGVDVNMFFVNHEENETKEGTSRLNMHEAKFLMGLLRHLILQGYSSDKITVLATYGAQVHVLEKLQKQDDLLGDVRISTVDNYQGEESDIILLSLVRSNPGDGIGFLGKENRVCVALSRARKGLYCLGNFNLLHRRSVLWRKISGKLNGQRAIGPSLRLKCKTHRRVEEVSSASDFLPLKNGGCSLTCGLLMPCGHLCEQLCHPCDLSHLEFLEKGGCKKKCGLRRSCGHVCNQTCHFDLEDTVHSEKCNTCLNLEVITRKIAVLNSMKTTNATSESSNYTYHQTWSRSSNQPSSAKLSNGDSTVSRTVSGSRFEGTTSTASGDSNRAYHSQLSSRDTGFTQKGPLLNTRTVSASSIRTSTVTSGVSSRVYSAQLPSGGPGFTQRNPSLNTGRTLSGSNTKPKPKQSCVIL